MSLDRTRAVVIRVLQQLRRDRRTLVIVFILPMLLLWLMDAMLTNSPGTFDRVGPSLLGFFPFVMLFLITSIAVLRERTQGTLDRLMASPVGRGDLLVGYAVAFALVGLIQAAVTMTVGIGLLGIPNQGNLTLAAVVVLGQALLGVAFGLFFSAFAQTEFQAVQFMPAVVIPQFLLAGMLVPIDQLPRGLEIAARALPLTYAFEALGNIMLAGKGLGDGRVLLDLTIIAAAVAVALVAGALTLRRSEA